MFKTFFKNVGTFMVMPFKSDKDIDYYSESHPRAAKWARRIKGIFTIGNMILDIISLKILIHKAGALIAKYPSIFKLTCMGLQTAAA